MGERRMRGLVMGCCVMLQLAGSAHVARALSVMGTGVETCAAWTDWRRYDNNNPFRVGKEAWSLGFLSGQALSDGVDYLRDSTPASL